MTTLHILSLYLSSLRLHKPPSKSIKQKMDTLKEPFTLPNTIPETQRALKSAQKKARELNRSDRAYKSTAYKEHEEAFVAVHQDAMGEKRAKIIFNRGGTFQDLPVIFLCKR